MRTVAAILLTLIVSVIAGCGGSSQQLSAPAPANPEVVRQEDQAVSAAEAAEAARQAKEAARP